VVEALARRGLTTVAEASRTYIREELARGRTLTDIRADDAAYQRTMVARKVATEAALDPDSTVVFDRGMPDSISYFRKAGLDPEEARRACLRFRYATVFLFERLPLLQDGARVEDDAMAARLEAWLAQDYAALGYEVVRIPVLPIEERVQRVLEHLG